MEKKEDSLVQCYNKGCGQKFDPSTNTPESCLFHPGSPYFHDAYKIWNCCQKKSTDFGTWLSYPGCTKGAHSNEKPIEDLRLPANKELLIAQEGNEEMVIWNGLTKPAERLTLNGTEKKTFLPLTMEVTETARIAIDKALNTPINDQSQIEDKKTIEIGTACTNAACEQTFMGESTIHSLCRYHPGVAIFHEGLKFWSCCNKKTSDFQAFLEQKGCETGEHCWVKKEKVDRLREDWFCRSGFVHINIYCRGTIPEQTLVQSDGLHLNVDVVHGFGKARTSLDYDLFGAIDPVKSTVIIGERKLELRLCQATVPAWPRLRFEPGNAVDNA